MKISQKIAEAAKEALQEMYGQEVAEKMIQLQETRPEFEGNLTLVVFPFLKMSKKSPEATAQDLGEKLVEKIGDVVLKFNVVKGFLNLVINPAQWIMQLQEVMMNEWFGFTPVTEQSP